ncbi:MAG: hypothetical protein AB8H12_07920, partial [Lewinella sp.]
SMSKFNTLGYLRHHVVAAKLNIVLHFVAASVTWLWPSSLFAPHSEQYFSAVASKANFRHALNYSPHQAGPAATILA